MQPGELVKLFTNLDSLEIGLSIADAQAAGEAVVRYQSRIQQLTALTGLCSLKVQWAWECFPALSQVSCYRFHRCMMSRSTRWQAC